jgi:enoyl-[acyl-carrier protein] reductase II
MPGRAMAGAAADRVLALERDGAPKEELLAAISGRVNKLGALEGQLEEGWVWAGQGAGLIHDIPTVKELLDRMVSEAEGYLRQAARAFE